VSTWVSVAATIAAVVSAGIAFLVFRENRGDRRNDQLKKMIEAALQPVLARITSIEQQNADSAQHLTDLIEMVVGKHLQPLREQIVVLETKIDVFWKQVAMDAAKILHQPDPRRAKIDALLDAFMEDALSPEEELVLRKYLLQIRNWEPGEDLGFPVHPGEQAVAALLLRTMNSVLTPRHAGAHYTGDMHE
jgi:uncharacterized membrane protein YccC